MNQPASTPLRIAVIGGGAFGKNHLRVFSELAADQTTTPVTLAVLVEPDSTRRRDLAARYGVAAFASVDDLLQSGLALDAATVCVPTVAHAAVATQLLEAGLDILIEKPITVTLAEADALLALASARNRLIAVGHLERFNPAVTACFSRLTRPMFFEAHRLSVFTPRSLDVDVVLDLMIHDLDVVLSFVDSPVREIRAVGLPVLSRKVDIANVRVEFENGCIANFTASRVSTERVRKLRFFQPHQYLSLDFARQDLLMIDVTAAAALDPAQLATLTQDLRPGHPRPLPAQGGRHPGRTAPPRDRGLSPERANPHRPDRLRRRWPPRAVAGLGYQRRHPKPRKPRGAVSGREHGLTQQDLADRIG